MTTLQKEAARMAELLAARMAQLLELEILRLMGEGAEPEDITIANRQGSLERQLWVKGQCRVSINLPFSGTRSRRTWFAYHAIF